MTCDWCKESREDENNQWRWLTLIEEGIAHTRELEFCTYACLKRWCAA